MLEGIGFIWQGDRGQAPVPSLKVNDLYTYSLIQHCNSIINNWCNYSIMDKYLRIYRYCLVIKEKLDKKVGAERHRPFFEKS